jgi:hypothetical protein
MSQGMRLSSSLVTFSCQLPSHSSCTCSRTCLSAYSVMSTTERTPKYFSFYAHKHSHTPIVTPNHRPAIDTYTRECSLVTSANLRVEYKAGIALNALVVTQHPIISAVDRTNTNNTIQLTSQLTPLVHTHTQNSNICNSFLQVATTNKLII